MNYLKTETCHEALYFSRSASDSKAVLPCFDAIAASQKKGAVALNGAAALLREPTHR